ncbi:MAG: hypothetical protein R6U63_10295 [Longimicrobiales bacterium]
MIGVATLLAVGAIAGLGTMMLRVLREYERAVVYFRVSDPVKAVVEIENYLFATSQLAQTTLRSVVWARPSSMSPWPSVTG